MIHAGDSNFWSCGYKYTSPNYMAVVSESNDGGATWERHVLYSGSSYGYIRAIASDPANPLRVFAAGMTNSVFTVFITEDGGSSWNTINPSGFSGTPYDMIFHPTDPARLAIASSSGLYQSADGGSSWSKVTGGIGTSYELYRSDNLGALVISTSAGIWVWSDWNTAPVYWGEDPGIPGVRCVLDKPDEHLLAGTSGAAVWSSYTGTPVEGGSGAVPSSTGIGVAPNPAPGGMAVVSFTLPRAGMTHVTVHDMSGRIVSRIAAEPMEAGCHTLGFSTGEMPCGVYFAALRSGSIMDSARFVVAD